MRSITASKTSHTAFAVSALLGISSVLCAQQPKPPILEEILKRLEANLNRYDNGLPSLFCDEHVVSGVDPAQRNQGTVTDSIFRLKRATNPDHSSTLVESRDIKYVNGKPATKQDMGGPSLVDGVFEGGLAVVSLDQTACMNYTLQRIDAKHPTDPYIVRFANVLTPENSAGCLLQEDTKGRASIDPASMQITHLELTTPHHVIIPGYSYVGPVIGKRELTVDYAPVVLGSQTFWMPTTITSRSTAGAGTFHMTVWTYRATYSNCHRLEVTSRILLPGETPDR